MEAKERWRGFYSDAVEEGGGARRAVAAAVRFAQFAAAPWPVLSRSRDFGGQVDGDVDMGERVLVWFDSIGPISQ